MKSVRMHRISLNGRSVNKTRWPKGACAFFGSTAAVPQITTQKLVRCKADARASNSPRDSKYSFKGTSRKTGLATAMESQHSQLS